MDKLHRKLVLLSAVLFVTAGCSSIAIAPIPVSIIKSPVTVSAFETNGPIDESHKCYLKQILPKESAQNNDEKTAETDCKSSTSIDNNISNIFDSFDDLCSKESIFLIAISGGGARASAFAMYTMDQLEQCYNAKVKDLKIENPPLFIDNIDVFSTVSGGSMYAYQVGRFNTYLKKVKVKENKNIGEIRKELFQKINKYSDIQHIGSYTALTYFSTPFPILLTLFTNFDYLHILSMALNSMEDVDENKFRLEIADESSMPLDEVIPHFFSPVSYKLSNLVPEPRFFFNATALETGLPFLFTQRYVHLPIKEKYARQQTARLDLQFQEYIAEKNKQEKHTQERHNIFNALTLEDINSSPWKTPLAYAAMASAAFPMGFEPLEFIKYDYSDTKKVFAAAKILHISDGGIYDNSGLTPLIDLIGYLKDKNCKTKKVILLSINADPAGYDVLYSQENETSQEEDLYQKSWLDINIPFRNALGSDALNLIHYLNKRRAEQLAIERIYKMGIESCRSEKNGNIQFLFFPVNLQQFSRYDEYGISDLRDPESERFYKNLKNIPTSYEINSEDRDLLLKAAKKLLETKQENGWCGGKNQSVQEELIKALLSN